MARQRFLKKVYKVSAHSIQQVKSKSRKFGQKTCEKKQKKQHEFSMRFSCHKGLPAKQICIAHGRRSPFELSGTLVVIEELCLQSCAKELPKVFQASGFHNDMYSQ